jgi:hypothetical protein
MTPRRVTLLGDAIERPGNAVALWHAAQLFGAACGFRPPMAWAGSPEWAALDAAPQAYRPEDLAGRHARCIAFDNLPGARDVYGFRAGDDFAVMVGNERRGLSPACRAVATDAVQIPMASRRINCLNVAAAAAVALYQLCGSAGGAGRAMQVRSQPESRRPELLLMGAGDHVELGSAIRSAAAFGWPRAWIDDREQAWFGVARPLQAEGRAAARRSRNPIHLLPCGPAQCHDFAEVVVVTAGAAAPGAVPLQRADLARGARQLVVVPDESRVAVDREDWARLGQRVRFVGVDLPHPQFNRHYRFVASIVMAEVARQVGLRKPGPGPTRAGPPDYGLALERAPQVGEPVWLEDLAAY